MRMLLCILLLLALVTPVQAANSLNIEWRDAATIRVDWVTPGQVSCVYVVDTPTGLCGESGSTLVPFDVYAGLLVTVRAGDAVLIGRIIPDNPYPLPMTVAWGDSILTITIANPSPTRCLRLIGGGRLDSELPDSCGVTTYTIGYNYISDGYAPAGRWVQLRDLAGLVYQLPVPPRYEVALPLVVGGS